jgi:hypothetical protein
LRVLRKSGGLANHAAFHESQPNQPTTTCSFTGVKIINDGGRSEVQAAHIRPVMASGRTPQRHRAVRNVHWMFDRGLISIADYHELLFARGKIPKQVTSLLKPDRRLLVPSRPEKAPHPIFCAGIAKTFSRGDQCLSCLPRHCEAKPKQSIASRLRMDACITDRGRDVHYSAPPAQIRYGRVSDAAKARRDALNRFRRMDLAEEGWAQLCETWCIRCARSSA